MALDYKVYPGQYVKIDLNGVLRFAGVINGTSSKKVQNGINTIFQDVECVGFNNIPSRRTIKIDYAADTTASVVIADMVDDFLVQDGVTSGTINTGIVFKDEWRDDVICIADVLDECAARSGYQWFIDKNMALQFYQDPTTVSTSTYNLIDGDSFTDYRDVTVNETIDNYVNKVFVLGGNDDHGDPIIAIRGDATAQNEMQSICAGTGVYGQVHRDPAIVGHEYITAVSGTSPTTIAVGGHPFATGDYFWNVTRNAYSIITDGTSDPDFAECESVASQASGDVIEVYGEANQIARNVIKKQATIPTIVEFSSFNIDWEPGYKIQISLSDVSVSGYFNIDEVSITEDQATYFKSKVKCVKRNESNFSTQKNSSYVEFFRGF
jgi:hypothetical protein